MRTSLTRTLALGAASLAVAGGALVLPGIADAQTAHAGYTLTATPTQTTPGGTVEFVATGCSSQEFPGEELVVSFTTEGGSNYVGQATPDADGRATLSLTFPVEATPGTFDFEATCFHPEGTEGGGTTLFTYEALDVTIVAPTTTTTAPASTTTTAKPAAAAATATRPSFTG